MAFFSVTNKEYGGVCVACRFEQPSASEAVSKRGIVEVRYCDDSSNRKLLHLCEDCTETLGIELAKWKAQP